MQAKNNINSSVFKVGALADFGTGDCVIEDLIAEMAMECADRLRNEGEVNLRDYLAKCPNAESRRVFRIIVGMSALADTIFLKD